MFLLNNDASCLCRCVTYFANSFELLFPFLQHTSLAQTCHQKCYMYVFTVNNLLCNLLHILRVRTQVYNLTSFFPPTHLYEFPHSKGIYIYPVYLVYKIHFINLHENAKQLLFTLCVLHVSQQKNQSNTHTKTRRRNCKKRKLRKKCFLCKFSAYTLFNLTRSLIFSFSAIHNDIKFHNFKMGVSMVYYIRQVCI